jgi:hypothetical protein
LKKRRTLPFQGVSKTEDRIPEDSRMNIVDNVPDAAQTVTSEDQAQFGELVTDCRITSETIQRPSKSEKLRPEPGTTSAMDIRD